MDVFIFVFSIAASGMAFWQCRCFSIFFDEARCQLGIRLRSIILSDILIAAETKPPNIGRSMGPAMQNVNKMSLVGLLAHILIDPLCAALIVLAGICIFAPSPELEALRECS